MTEPMNKNMIPIAKLLQKPLIRTQDLRDNGHHPSLLSYYTNKGLLERVGRGLYRNTEYSLDNMNVQWEGLAYTVLSIPRGVVTGISALDIYGITEEIPRQYWIAVPHNTSIGTRTHTKIIKHRNHGLGISKTSIGDIEIPIYDLERTLIDAFKLLSIETAIKALRFAFNHEKHKPNINKIQKYSKKLRVSIHEYLLMVTTI